MDRSNEQKPLLPAYLVVGSDSLKRRRVVERLKERIAAIGDISFNLDDFNGETALGSDIVASCNTLPFAGDVRLVNLTKADKLKKADSEELVAYLSSPNPTTVLCLEAEKLAKSTRLYKAVAAMGAQAVIVCDMPAKRDMASTVRAMATSHGVTFTPGAAAALVELVGTDTVRLDGEIAKIALAHRGTDAVNENEVYAMTARTAEVKPWDFVNAFSARDLKKCMLCLKRMESSSPYALIAMATTRIRELICAKTMDRRGTRSRLQSALGKQEWQVKSYFTDAAKFRDDELRRALTTARDAEQAMKSGADPQTAFVEWMVSVLRR